MRSAAAEPSAQPDDKAHERRLQDESPEKTRVKPYRVASGLAGSALAREEGLELGVAMVVPAECGGRVDHSPTVSRPAPGGFGIFDGGVREAFVEGFIA